MLNYNHEWARAVDGRIIGSDDFEGGFASRCEVDGHGHKVSDNDNLKQPREDWPY